MSAIISTEKKKKKARRNKAQYNCVFNTYVTIHSVRFVIWNQYQASRNTYSASASLSLSLFSFVCCCILRSISYYFVMLYYRTELWGEHNRNFLITLPLLFTLFYLIIFISSSQQERNERSIICYFTFNKTPPVVLYKSKRYNLCSLFLVCLLIVWIKNAHGNITRL